MLKIIEYEEKYLEDVRELLVELEQYIISIDEDNLDQLHNDYREKMALIDLEEVKQKNGICYLAVENNTVLGCIMGIIPEYDQYDYLDFKCPKRGEIIELIVSKMSRGNGIGKLLIDKMEDYFKSMDCEYSYVDVFAYNKRGQDFYNREGYHSRMFINLKKLK